MARTRDPLEPATTSVQLTLTLVAVLTGLTVLAVVFGSGSLFGIGSPSVCVEQPDGVVPGPPPGAGGPDLKTAADGVTASTGSVALCTVTPSAGQRVLGALEQLPGFLVLVGALLLASRLFRGMRRHGIFTDVAAARLRAIGWFVLVGELVATLGESVARFSLANTMLTEPLGSLVWLGEWDIPVLAVFLGVVLISVGRLMRISAAMRDDLAGTV